MEKQATIQLTVAEVNLILKALSKLPLEEVITTFVKVKQSAEEQFKEESPKA